MRRARLAKRCAALLLLSIAAPITGCSRHVVVDPRTVTSRNDPDWNVRAEPRPSGTAETTPAPSGAAEDASATLAR